MKAYMTNGTYSFLKQLEQKHQNKQFFFMNSDTNTLAYYEGKGKSIFVSGRTYDILLAKGRLGKQGFVAMNHLPVTEEGQPVFEHQYKSADDNIISAPGLQAFRLLKPTKGHVYVILTQWTTKAAYEEWQHADEFSKVKQMQQQIKLPAYFADRPFLVTYQMVKEDEANER